MSFNSFTFAVFFCLTYLAYWSLPRRLSNVVLLVASYVFYGWWDYRFLGLLAVSTVVDYCAGRMIDRRDSPMARRLFLTLSIATNLGILGVFKYANFFADSFVSAMDSLGLNADVRFAQVVLPVGISFYTFQTMSYTIDVYRREIPACRSFLDFALFVSFFPQLVAGPIERARVVLPQLAQQRRPRRDQFESACWLILTGFYLKCVIADNMAPIAQRVFDYPESVHGMEIVIGVWAAAFQIYGDFAGYSRIAIGVAKLFGIDLMTNFNRPYLAVNPSDFWRRWHISLSTWLRDYLYIPLGGSRVSKVLTYRNLMITMILGGLWHGAAWNFIFWGIFHGAILCLWKLGADLLKRFPGVAQRLPRIPWALRVFIFFQVTCLGWILFFIPHVSALPLLMSNLVQQWEWNGSVTALTLIYCVAPLVFYELVTSGDAEQADGRAPRRFGISGLRPSLRMAVYGGICFAVALTAATGTTDFIYFQF